MIFRSAMFAASLALGLGACNTGGSEPSAGPEGGQASGETGTFDAIASGETVNYSGTEPFWGGAAGGGMATYSTPENPDGSEFPIERFAGNNGLGISGEVDGRAFDLTVTPGECSDGMSDRLYPYTATLLIGGEQRQGCAWTDSQPFSGREMP